SSMFGGPRRSHLLMFRRSQTITKIGILMKDFPISRSLGHCATRPWIHFVHQARVERWDARDEDQCVSGAALSARFACRSFPHHTNGHWFGLEKNASRLSISDLFQVSPLKSSWSSLAIPT